MNKSVILVRWGGRLAALGVVAAAGFFGGSTLARLAAHGVRVVPTLVPSSVATLGSGAPVVHLTAIGERNLFGARRDAAGGGGGFGRRVCGDARPGDARACSGWQLRGTVVGDRPSWSAAVVYETVRQRTRVVTVGPTGDDTEVCEIRPGALLVRRGDHLELCTTDPPAANAPPQPAGIGVRQLTADEYEVNRAEIEYLRSDLHEVLKSVRLVPVTGGFKAFAIKPGSFCAQVGLKNGDVLTAINSERLASPGSLVGFFGQLESLDEVAVELTRRGQPYTLRYRIVD